MSDLISRKKVIDILEKEKSLRCSYDADIAIFSIEKGIRELPTAYDVDKVVAELEINSFITVKNEEVQTKRKDIQSYISVEKEVVLLKDAIEIVKQGSVSDDVCEWKEIIGFDDVYIKNPHTNVLYINETKRKNIYCNTCGKKIKVVE